MNVFDLFARISLDTKDYENELENAGKKTEKTGKNIKELFSNLSKTAIASFTAISAAATAAAAVVVKLVNSTATYGDTVDKASQKLGISAKAYQEWSAILEHSGASIEGLKEGMRTLRDAIDQVSATAKRENEISKLQKEYEKSIGIYGKYAKETVSIKLRIRELKNASVEDLSASAKAFNSLGISVVNASGDMRSVEDIFSDTVTALQNVEDPVKRSASAMDIFGESAMELGALLNTSSEDTEKMRKRVHELGGVMSDEGVKSSAQFKDNLQDLRTAAQGVLRTGLQDALPDINKSINKIIRLFTGPEGEKARKAVSDIAKTIARGISNAIPRLLSLFDDGAIKLKVLGGVIAGVALTIKAIKNPIGALVSGFSLLAGGIAIAALTADDYRKKLANLTNEQIENIDASLNQISSYRDIRNERDKNIYSINKEMNKIEDLWEELQKLADESGKVKDQDKNRAEFILNELNKALGTEYQLNGNIIQSYKDIGKEIDNLIKKKRAEMLLNANLESYTAAQTNLKSTREGIYDQEKVVNKAREKMKSLEKYNVSASAAIMAGNYSVIKRNEYIRSKEQYEKELNKLNELKEQEKEYYHDIEEFESAQKAIAEGRYDDVLDLYNIGDISRYEDLISSEKLTTQDVNDIIRTANILNSALKRYEETFGKEGEQYKILLEQSDKANELLEKIKPKNDYDIYIKYPGLNIDELYDEPTRGVGGLGGNRQFAPTKTTENVGNYSVNVNLNVDKTTFGKVSFQLGNAEKTRNGGRLVNVI